MQALMLGTHPRRRRMRRRRLDTLEADDVGALVVSDDGRKILGIISAGNIVRGLETFGRDVVDRPLGD